MIKLPDDVPDMLNLTPEQQTEFNAGFWYAVEKIKRLNATAQPVSDGWVKCSERLPPVKTAIIVGKWNGRLWATKWATYIPSHPEANSFGYIMPGGSWEPDFWMVVPAAPGGQDG